MNILNTGNELLDVKFMELYIQIIKNKDKFLEEHYERGLIAFHEIMIEFIDEKRIDEIKSYLDKNVLLDKGIKLKFDSLNILLSASFGKYENTYPFDLLTQFIEEFDCGYIWGQNFLYPKPNSM